MKLFAGYPWFITMVNAMEQELKPSLQVRFKGLVASLARLPVFDSLIVGHWGPRLEAVRGRHGFVSRYARIYQIFGACGAAGFLTPKIRSQEPWDESWRTI